jgi:hypothetical protein
MSREHPQLRIRIDPELKKKLEDAAHHNRRSFTAEVVERLEASFEPSIRPLESSLPEDHATRLTQAIQGSGLSAGELFCEMVEWFIREKKAQKATAENDSPQGS